MDMCHEQAPQHPSQALNAVKSAELSRKRERKQNGDVGVHWTKTKLDRYTKKKATGFGLGGIDRADRKLPMVLGFCFREITHRFVQNWVETNSAVFSITRPNEDVGFCIRGFIPIKLSQNELYCVL